MTATAQARFRPGGILLENQDVGTDVQRRMGKPVRRLRALLPGKARGRGHRQDLFHPCLLQVARFGHSCGCKDYKNRSAKVPDCVRLTPENVRTLNWLPPSCGYKLVAEGRDLYWWHPLISGDPDTVHEAGVSVRGRVQGTENEIADADLEDHIVQWPALLPKRARLKKRPA